MRPVGPPVWAKVMDGGKHGPLGSHGSRARRGPSRYGLEQVLEEIATRQHRRVSTHHAIAKADTSFLWRRSLRALGFRNFAAMLRLSAAGQPDVPRVVTGDWNTKGAVDLGLGLREVPTPATYGRWRYDRVQVSPTLFTGRPATARTLLDHRCVAVTVSDEANPPDPKVSLDAPLDTSPAVRRARPGRAAGNRRPPNPFRPGWRRRRRRHPRLFHQAVRRWGAWKRRNR
jgi:hypothetical protein